MSCTEHPSGYPRQVARARTIEYLTLKSRLRAVLISSRFDHPVTHSIISVRGLWLCLRRGRA